MVETIARSRLTPLRILEIVVIAMCTFVSARETYIHGVDTLGGLALLTMGTNVVGLMVVCTIFGSLCFIRSPAQRDELFMLMLTIEGLVLFFNVISWSEIGTESLTVQYIGRYFENILLLVLGFLLWRYVCTCIPISPEKVRLGDYHVLAFFIVGAYLLTVNPMNGWMFTIGADGAFGRGPLMFVFYIMVCMMVVVGTVFVLWFGDTVRYKAISVSYLLITLVLMGVQFSRPGLSLFYICPLITLLIMYVNFYITQNEQALKRESEICAEKYDAMITQLQPHFLYNALTSIMAIKGNPQETRDAICDFSKYLRENIASAETMRPIPFRMEVDHVETYLALEKLRFKEKLDYELDIKDNMFPIPPLALQMLVENAIHYSITMTPMGGKITVTSERLSNVHHIRVFDNGVGFDSNNPRDREMKTRGLEFCRKRLKEDVGGRLTVSSDPEMGTCVDIFIPFQN